MANKSEGSQKQKKATELVLKGQSASSAMRDAGYSENSAKNPKTLTQSQYFIDTMEKYGVTDEKIAKVMNDGLEATKQGEADHNTRHKYMETALRVKGHQASEPTGKSLTGMVIIVDGDKDIIDAEADQT